MTHHIAKITEIIGSSDKGWEDAALKRQIVSNISI
jgi:flavin-binding protein dodecin